jgi:phosphoribosylformylglycinamidine cyclo-ligase
VTEVREPQPVFRFIARAGGIDVREMYATFNMGVGFAAYVRAGDADRCVSIATQLGYDAWRAGSIKKSGERKAVEIVPMNVTFESETLGVR